MRNIEKHSICCQCGRYAWTKTYQLQSSRGKSRGSSRGKRVAQIMWHFLLFWAIFVCVFICVDEFSKALALKKFRWIISSSWSFGDALAIFQWVFVTNMCNTDFDGFHMFVFGNREMEFSNANDRRKVIRWKQRNATAHKCRMKWYHYWLLLIQGAIVGVSGVYCPHST